MLYACTGSLRPLNEGYVTHTVKMVKLLEKKEYRTLFTFMDSISWVFLFNPLTLVMVSGVIFDPAALKCVISF